jgi:hypothetical protein
MCLSDYVKEMHFKIWQYLECKVFQDYMCNTQYMLRNITSIIWHHFQFFLPTPFFTKQIYER